MLECIVMNDTDDFVNISLTVGTEEVRALCAAVDAAVANCAVIRLPYPWGEDGETVRCVPYAAVRKELEACLTGLLIYTNIGDYKWFTFDYLN